MKKKVKIFSSSFFLTPHQEKRKKKDYLTVVVYHLPWKYSVVCHPPPFLNEIPRSQVHSHCLPIITSNWSRIDLRVHRSIIEFSLGISFRFYIYICMRTVDRFCITPKGLASAESRLDKQGCQTDVSRSNIQTRPCFLQKMSARFFKTRFLSIWRATKKYSSSSSVIKFVSYVFILNTGAKAIFS